MTVHIVTDSTCDISHALVDELRITVVPLTIQFGDQSFRDGQDLNADEFYARLQEEKQLPTTSQPPPALFEHAYRHLSSFGDVVSVHLSHKFSGTVDTARRAAEDVARDRISVVDSGSVSMGLGLCVLAAARVARAGGSRHDCVAAAESVAARLHVAVAFETLEFLRRGGRIGRARAFLGGLLHLKPILTVQDGEAVPLKRVRTHRQAMDELVALCARHQPVAEAAVLHTTTPEAAADVADRARAALPGVLIHVGRFGPVLGVHGGPGMLGIAVVEA
ncbi:MAG TPA: DegV family protein [Dehalococcoidia bacterium]|nr:DegV family protein [Dehalococcoidia bacterium]